MAAAASVCWRRHRPRAPAAASNQRPALLLRGQCRSPASITRTVSAMVVPTSGPNTGTISSPRPSACSTAAARRQGSRAATSPPGSASGASAPSRCHCGTARAPPTHSNSPPQALPSVPSPIPSRAIPMQACCRACSAATTATWAWWCCTATAGTPCRPATSSARCVLKKSGCRSCATAARGPPAAEHKASTDCSKAARLSASARSPCSADQCSRSPSTRQARFLR